MPAKPIPDNILDEVIADLRAHPRDSYGDIAKRHPCGRTFIQRLAIKRGLRRLDPNKHRGGGRHRIIPPDGSISGRPLHERIADWEFDKPMPWPENTLEIRSVSTLAGFANRPDPTL